MQLFNLAPLLPGFSIRILHSVVEDAGLDGEGVLKSANLTRDDLDNPALLVTGVQELAAQRAFATATRKTQELWTTAGMRYRTLAFYPLGFAQITAPSLAEALDLTRRFASLHSTVANFEQTDDGSGNAGIRMTYDPGVEDILDFLRCRDTVTLTNWLHELWGGRFPFTRIETASALPAQAGFDYRAAVVTHGLDSCWYWPRSLLAKAPIQADPVLHQTYVAECEAIVAAAQAGKLAAISERSGDPLVARIVNLVERSPRLSLTLDQVAGELLLSRRSLQRKLTERGISYRNIVDDIRKGMARQMLADTHLSAGEIAWQLGYADSSSFHQAFMRWYGMSPGAFRKQLRDESRS